MTTKIVALTDALGNLVRFVLLPGQRFDTVGVAPLIKDIEFGGLIADKAEPRRVCRRLQLLRGWSYDEENIGKIFT